jgi:subtilisin-like proprotein convertase family protein
MRKVVLILLCLLSLVAVWLLWPRGGGSPSAKNSVAPSASASAHAVAAKVAAPKKISSLNLTNPLAFRLANTALPLRELMFQPHAILLQNALIDTDARQALDIPSHLKSAGQPGAYLVQARGPVNNNFRSLLAADGAKIVSYIPNNAYLVNATPEAAGKLSGNPLVQAVLPWEPYYKLQPSLLGLAVEQSPLPPGMALNLGLFASDATAEAQVQKAGATIVARDRSAFGPVLRVVAPANWTALAQLPGVQAVEPVFQKRLANDLSRVTLGITPDMTSGATNDWLGLTGLGVLVAVNDTGIDATHPDFATGRVTGATNDLVDTAGHGTHVAGIIAGNGSKSLSPVNVGANAQGSVTNADFRGKAPAADLYSFNYGRPDYLLQRNAAIQGALICNNSWDNGDAAYDLAASSYDAATRDAVPEQTGSQPVLFVFAAGNSGNGTTGGALGDPDTIMSPGTAKNAITVGALEQPRHITNIVTTVDDSGNTNQSAIWYDDTSSSSQVAAGSSRGNVGVGTEGAAGRFKPDVVAPGVFVVSTRSSQWDTNAYYSTGSAQTTTYSYEIVAAGSINDYLPVNIPPNAVGVTITVSANQYSPSPFPNMPIYVSLSGLPDTNNFVGYNNFVIPPDSPPLTWADMMNTGYFYFGIGNPTNAPVNYDVTVSVQVTNNYGDEKQVLAQMNDKLGPYYRYESGTSMSAAAVSGVLALMQDYFTNTLHALPSPALLKALLINGARQTAGNRAALTNALNLDGWGLPNITNSLPFSTTNQSIGTNSQMFFADQDPVTALATADSHTYLVTAATNAATASQSLRATLVWTDPPGDPNAAIKLVNNLDLIVTNLDTGDVYFGNNFSSFTGYSQRWNTNAAPSRDIINNVKQVALVPGLAAHYSVTVVARQVFVNAVTAQTNNTVQDFALVVSSTGGQTGAGVLTVTDGGLVTNPTGGQTISFVTTTNAPLFNQFAGANTPLLGTNTLALGGNTLWSSNGVLTVGMTNQWHFYVVTNNALDPQGSANDVTNAAFIVFNSETLSIPRMGTLANSDVNATRPQADIDLYVSTDPSLTNLNPAVISNCLAGTVTATANSFGSSLSQGGTEFVTFNNSQPGQVYYIGVKSEDHMAASYAFLPLFTSVPFSSLDTDGNQIANGMLLPMPVPDGGNANPGVTNVFALAIYPMTIAKVVVTNLNEHEDAGDLLGALSYGTLTDLLFSHNLVGDTFGAAPQVYDDSRHLVAGSTPTAGGRLTEYRGKSAPGLFIYSVEDDNNTATGRVSVLTIKIQPHRDLGNGTNIISVPPLGWFVDYVDVPPGYTNLVFAATNLPPTVVPPVQMYEKLGGEPDFNDYDQMALLTNCITGNYPSGTDPGNAITVGPPLNAGRYFIGLYNPSTTTAASVLLSATLGYDSAANNTFTFISGTTTPLPDDAVTGSLLVSNSPITAIIVPNTVTQLISSATVGIAVQSPRISDYAFTLVSPTGQRVLLMENRGGADTNGAGAMFVYTNVLSTTATGGAAPETNYLQVPLGASISVPIQYDFYTVPDEMTVYDGTNPATFNAGSGNLLLDTGFINNPSGPASTNVVTSGLYDHITIIMNQFGNTFNGGSTRWTYTAGAQMTNFQYLVFTDSTNLSNVPIKFAQPPFSFVESITNFNLSDFELATNGDYLSPTNVYDAFGGWTVPTNLVTVSTVFNLTNQQFVQVTNVLSLTNNFVSVVTDPSDAIGDQTGTNLLALGMGTITRNIATLPGRIYNVTFWFKGPGIAGWWRGEGDTYDSSDPEHNANNGRLVGRFNFPAGESGQSFGFEDGGEQFEFAGTNSYVQVPQNPSLDVGTAGGFTVEGWIYPTNLLRPQPVAEWLAKVPVSTNSADTNFSILAGPYLNPATGHFYYLLGATNWTISERWATNLGGHLATVNTANEQNWIFDNFASLGGVNRNLWIGLTNRTATIFGWSSGQTNSYTNWFPGQPLNNSVAAPATRNYTFIRGYTNSPSGLWVCADNNGFTQSAPTVTNIVYGVAEVNQIQTNGVQLWIAATNSMPGGTNLLAGTNGCIYANLIDVSNQWHEIWSAPGLLATNVFQHIALTFDTNSGLAKLFLNGTNIATTNLFLPGGVFTPFTPKTTGDLLLGRDMTLNTNNYFGGRMDEMSVYSRALSGAEIAAIYGVSVTASNGLAGKFDPTVTPAAGLAEAAVVYGGHTNDIIFGVNDQWMENSYTFTATSNIMSLRITGLQPGILLDDFNVSQAPLANLYYLPEQSLNDTLAGDSAAGTWTLEVWDSRAGAYVTNLTDLLSWQLNFILQSNATIAATLSPQTPTPSTVGPNQIVDYAVTVPSWAKYATNILVSSTAPVSLYFNQTSPPSATVPPDYGLLTNVTFGIGSPVLASTNVPSVPPLVPGQTYYLGVQNTNATAASVVLEVDYDITALTNGVPYSSALTTNDDLRYFSFNVTSNAYAATFQLLKMSSNADLVVRKGVPLPALTNTDFGSFNATNADENIYVLTNSSPVPLSAGQWYLGVIKRDAKQVNYTVLAKELDSNAPPAIIDLTNAAPFSFTAGPGAALTNFFRFHVTNSATMGLRFQLYNLTGNGDLTVQTNALPLAPPFFESSQNVGRNPEMILIFTNSAVTNLAADWYLGVPNHELTNISYTIVAAVDTNGYFPAFPGAQGMGGGAAGAGGSPVLYGHGTNGTVYHVTSLADDGSAGTLRDAVSSTNRTVVFDVSGTIWLQSRLVITNSFLNIAGQSAPGDGITVAGWETSVTNAHDVIIRYLRFRPGGGATFTNTVWANSFEGGVGNSLLAAGQYFAGWSVAGGDVEWLTNGVFGATSYDGSYFVDLNGTQPGSIVTNVPTVPGMTYTVSFAYARNPDSIGHLVPSAQLVVNSNILLSVSPATANSWANLQWALTSATFTATAASTPVEFDSLNAGASGVLLDAVSFATNTVVQPGFDALRLITVSNMIVDHVSATWAPRQVVSVIDSTNVTVQWSVMSQQLYATNFLGDGSQLRMGGGALSFHHNLYADNNAGSPHLADNVSLDFVNNVIYNWGTNAGSSFEDPTNNPNGFTNQINYTCNYLIAGSNSFEPWIAFRSPTNTTWIFQTNNFIDSDTNLVLNGGNTQWAMFTNQFTEFGQPFPLLPVATDEAFMAYERVLAFAGAALMQRDSADTNLVTSVRKQNGKIISSQSQVGGWPTLTSLAPLVDTDNDGIPDYWEITFFGTYPNVTNPIANLPATNVNSLGYTRLEEYLNWLGAPHALTATNLPVAVDLYKLTGNSGNLSFNVTNAVNGSVYLTNAWNGVTNTGPFSNSIALFTPNLNYSGYAAFDYYVTNNDTLGYFGPVTVSVVVSGVPVSPIITLTNLMPYTNFTSYSGLDYYRYDVSTNCYGVMFQILNPTGDVNLYASPGLPLPLVGNPVFDSSANLGTSNETIIVLNSSVPQAFTNGWWYLTVSNASGAVQQYTMLVTELTAPVFLYGMTNTNVLELTQLTVTNTAITYAPGHTVTYTNFLTIDTNAMLALQWTNSFANVTNTQPAIDTNGVITWTPSEAQGPGVYTLTTIAYDTNSSPVTSSTNSFDVTVYEVNTPPFWPTNVPSQTNYNVPNLITLTVTNTALDSDLPTNPLTYFLTVTPVDTNAPAVTNAVIDTNGIITWTPTLVQPPGIYTFTTIVTDTNVWALTNQVLSATNQFTVTVTPVALPLAFTHPAQSTTGTSAQLDGMITPGGLPATAWFQWGTSTNYGLVTPPLPAGATNFNVAYVTSLVTGLTVNVPYHFRLVVSNVMGAAYGMDQIFDQGYIVAWGADFLGQTIPIPAAATNNFLTEIGAGYDFSIAQNTNGSVIAWGDGIFGQTNVPVNLTNAVSVSGGYKDGLALRADRTVTVWGSSQFKQTGTNVPADLTNAVLAVSGDWHCLALRSDGTLTAWGNNSVGQTNVPAGLTNVVSMAAGGFHSLALKNDGTVVAWGDDTYGQTNVPAGLSNVLAVAGGESHSVALLNNGTLVAWGDNSLGQTNVPAGSNFIAIACGGFHSLALRNDGTVAQWGDSSAGQNPVFATTNLANVFAIAGSGGGGFHSLALTSLYGLNQTNNAPFWTNGSPTVTIFLVTNQPANVQFTNAATDTNIPAQILSYRLLNPPAWASIGQFTGVIAFTNVEPQGLGSNTLTVVVTDNGYPALSATNAVTVLVYEINTPPFWPAGVPSQTNYTVNVGNLLTVAAAATDADLPTNALTYSVSVSGGVTNAFIHPTNGVFTWIPSPSQATNIPYTVIVTVTDTNVWALTNRSLSATTNFTVTVLPPLTLLNGAPLTNTVAGNSVEFYFVPVPTNADFATNRLLSAAPAGVNVWFTTNAPPSVGAAGDALLIANSTGGSAIISTNTAPAFVPGGFYWLGVQNTNAVAVTNALEVDFHLVLPVSNTFTIYSIVATNNGTTNGFLLTWFAPSNDLFQVQWSPSLPPVWTTFPLPPFVTFNTNFPASAASAQFNFFDDGSQTGGFGTNRFYRLLLYTNAPNTPPVFLLNNAQFFFSPNYTNSVTNSVTDADLPPQTLAYALVSPPAGVTISTNGVITWAPTLAQAGTTNQIKTVVTDSGTPPLSATNIVTIFVNPVPVLGSVTLGTNGLTLQWSGWTNEQFEVQWATNLPPVWTLFPGVITSTNGVFSFLDTNAPFLTKFYQLILLP